jgi:LacI family transcriptional regulator
LMGRPRQNDDRITIQAVAKRAGVSPMTVSNVTNGTGRVSHATRERVRAVIQELGYIPSQAARGLVGSAVTRVGLIYSNVESMFINATLAAVAVVSAEKGIQLQMKHAVAASPEATADLARALMRTGAQALLLIPPFAEMIGGSPILRELKVPAAAIATAMALPHATTVRIDNQAAARAITERLIASGRRRIAVVAGPRNHSDSVARLRGHCDALNTHELRWQDDLCVDGDFSFASGLAAADRLLDLVPRPDAIVAANDDMAAAVLWAAHRRGMELPADLAVTGFDDTLIATRVWPPLTTVRQPIKEMAAQAIEWLARAVRDPDKHLNPQDLVLPFSVIERISG